MSDWFFKWRTMMMTPDFIIDVTEANFDSLVIEYSHQNPVVVDFWAEWCAPCKMLGPMLEQLAKEAGGSFRLAKVDVDSNQNLALRFGVHSIPAVKGFKGGQVVLEFVGVQPEMKIREFIQKIAPSPYDLLLEKARSFLINQNWHKAEETLHDILEQDPENSRALLGLTKCYLVVDKASEALDILRRFPASKEYRSAEMLLPLAIALVDLNKSDNLDTSPLEAAYLRSLRLIKRGNLPAAMDGLLDVLREDKHFHQDTPRLILLSLLEILGDENDLSRQYRQELASVLF
jgi:putative thioredoxin